MGAESMSQVPPSGAEGWIRGSSAEKVSVLHDAPLTYRSAVFLEAVRRAKDAGRSNSPVLFRGPSGAGKGRLARAMHEEGPRRKGPFIVCSVADLPESLVQSELFGHVKGAYSGADSDRLGLLQAADGGTIIFDDVDKFALSAQPCLHRFLDDRRVRPVGSSRYERVDVRIASATNRDLEELASKGLFQGDLAYRLSEDVIYVPPLRERREDIAPLVEYLVRAYALEQGRPVPTVEPGAMEVFEAGEWPGNARDVARAVRWCVREAERRVITKERAAEAPGVAGREASRGSGAERARLKGLTLEERRSKEMILRALELSRGKMREAAEILAVPLRTLQRDCQRFEIRMRGGGRRR